MFAGYVFLYLCIGNNVMMVAAKNTHIIQVFRTVQSRTGSTSMNTAHMAHVKRICRDKIP